jgi:putative FmdB family regulatory protein
MPTYEYKCPLCGVVKEVEHSVAELDNIVLPCKLCLDVRNKAVEMKRQISTSTSFRLVGGGWAAHGYVTPGVNK